MVDLDNYVAQWKAHKYKKPVRGGIILNQDWTKVCSTALAEAAATSLQLLLGTLPCCISAHIEGSFCVLASAIIL